MVIEYCFRCFIDKKYPGLIYPFSFLNLKSSNPIRTKSIKQIIEFISWFSKKDLFGCSRYCSVSLGWAYGILDICFQPKFVAIVDPTSSAKPKLTGSIPFLNR